MPTVDELNAAVDALHGKAPKLLTLIPNRNIPFVGNLHAEAVEIFNTHPHEVTPVLLECAKAALEAAEAVRAKAKPAS